MSANLDLVRSIYAAWERGDFSRADWADPEIEYSWVEGPAPRTWTGLKGMAEANQDVLGAWDDVRLEAMQYREIDNQRVFVQFVQYGRARRAGWTSLRFTSRRRTCSRSAKEGSASSSCTGIESERSPTSAFRSR